MRNDSDAQETLEKLKWEYSLIQEKIDRYGDISFKIKGFLITVSSGLTFYIVKEKEPLLPLFAFIATLILLWYETINNIYRHALSRRAYFIENALGYKRIQRKFKIYSPFPYQTPGIARSLSEKGMLSFESIINSIKHEWKVNLLYFILAFVYVILFIGLLLFKLL